MSSSHNVRLGYLSLIAATAFWGGNFVLGKVLSGTVPPITLTYIRWFPATLYQGLKTTTALNARLYLAVVPVLVLFLNLLVLKEKIKPLILLGAIISLFWVIWLLIRGDLSHLTELNINHGDLWAIGSAISWAVYCFIIRLRPQNISNTAFLTVLVGLAVVTLTPLFLYEFWQESAKILANLTAGLSNHRPFDSLLCVLELRHCDYRFRKECFNDQLHAAICRNLQHFVLK